MRRHAYAAVFLAVLVAGSTNADTVVTFDSGTEDWTGSGNTFIDPTGGNPGNNLRTIFQSFGITFRNLSKEQRESFCFPSVSFWSLHSPTCPSAVQHQQGA